MVATLALGLIAAIYVFNGGYYIESGAAGKRDNSIALAQFLKQHKREVGDLLAVTNYAVYGNNPKPVTARYQELARGTQWLKTVQYSHDTEGHWAKFGTKLNNLPSAFATVKGKTRDAVITKQKTFYSDIVVGIAELLEQLDANEGSHEQKKLELSSFLLKLFQAYHEFHSNDKRQENDNDRAELY